MPKLDWYTSREWPFDESNFYLILNLAVGGTWAGAQGIDETAFPASFEVDWVKVYQGADQSADYSVLQNIECNNLEPNLIESSESCWLRISSDSGMAGCNTDGLWVEDE